MLRNKGMVALSYGIAAAVTVAVVVVSVAWGVGDSAPYYAPAALIVLAAGAIHYNSRNRNR